MNFSHRQIKIIAIVKENEPISGDEIAKELGVAKATLRSDLAVLTMTGTLDARPKVGYFYSGQTTEPLLFEKLYHTKIETLMTAPMLIKQSISINDAIVHLFMYDVDSLYVINDQEALVGIVSRKDLLRAAMNNAQLSTTPVAVIMTRTPNIITITKNTHVLEAGHLLNTHNIDSLPVVCTAGGLNVIGKVSKLTILEYFIKYGIEIEQKKSQ